MRCLKQLRRQATVSKNILPKQTVPIVPSVQRMGFRSINITLSIRTKLRALQKLWPECREVRLYALQLPRYLYSRHRLMLTWGSAVDLRIKELRDCFSWGELKGTIVDVGGGSGHISISLARVSAFQR